MAITATSFIVLEDGSRRKKAGELIYEGQPLTLDTNGELKAAGATDKVYGLSKLNSNAYEDRAFGDVGAYGSEQLTVIVSGIVSVGSSVFNSIEVDTSMTAASSATTVKIFDDSKTYAVGDELYVSAGGLITNDNAGGKASLLGKVLKTPTQTADGSLELELIPSATTTASKLA